MCLSTVKLLGVVQQGGYKNRTFFGWLRRKDNLQFNRLAVLSLCLALASTVVALCFSFLGTYWALFCSAAPYLVLLIVFGVAGKKYALRLPVRYTGRCLRLFAVYFLFTAVFAYVFIALLTFLAVWNGSALYALIGYAPFAVLPMLLPLLLCAANAVTGVFENARNRRFVKKAGKKLYERKITRVAVVGSYGKTSVKNILKTLLSERYAVIETPASYNTPMGIAKTVCSAEFEKKQVFIAEFGARKEGDILQLCAMVQPDYAVFTGVCAQHIATFGSVEGVFAEKSEILRCGAKKVVCGESLKELVKEDTTIRILDENAVRNLRLDGKKTAFTLSLGETQVEVTTPLLGRGAAEDIALAANLCLEMGLTAEEIAAGIAKLQPIPHRLRLIENNGVNILDDGYNCNEKSAEIALEVLAQFEGRKCVVTPGIVEGGILEEALNARLGERLAGLDADKVILVGDTLVGAVKGGYIEAGGEASKLSTSRTLAGAQKLLAEWVQTGDTVLFLNDLPDVY